MRQTLPVIVLSKGRETACFDRPIKTYEKHIKTYKTHVKHIKLSQQRTLTEGGLEFKAANQCSDRLDPFKKSPDVYSVRFCFFPVAFAGS